MIDKIIAFMIGLKTVSNLFDQKLYWIRRRCGGGGGGGGGVLAANV